jgi:hypothetical protein
MMDSHYSDMFDASKPEPAPKKGVGHPVHELVMEDLEIRALAGRKKYGSFLYAENGRDALIDAYQEALDLAMYLRQRIKEQTGK